MEFDDFVLSALTHAARANPDVVFDAVVSALCEYDDSSLEHSSGCMEIPDEAGTGVVASTRTITLDLTEEDGDSDESLAKIHDSTYPDGAKAIHIPCGPMTLVRREGVTTLLERSE